jgi:hypothetical protein
MLAIAEDLLSTRVRSAPRLPLHLNLRETRQPQVPLRCRRDRRIGANRRCPRSNWIAERVFDAHPCTQRQSSFVVFSNVRGSKCADLVMRREIAAHKNAKSGTTQDAAGRDATGVKTVARGNSHARRPRAGGSGGSGKGASPPSSRPLLLRRARWDEKAVVVQVESDRLDHLMPDIRRPVKLSWYVVAARRSHRRSAHGFMTGSRCRKALDGM